MELEENNEPILYDVPTHKEWPSITLDRNSKEVQLINSRKDWSWWSLSNTWLYKDNSRILFEFRRNWNLDFSSDGAYILILQDETMEMFSSVDFSSCFAKTKIQRDFCPWFRRVSFTPSKSSPVLVSISYSNGSVEVWDIRLNFLFSIVSQDLPQRDPGVFSFGNSYATIYFTNKTVSEDKWIAHLCTIDMMGVLNAFLISVDGYQELVTINVSSGSILSTAFYCETRSILILATSTVKRNSRLDGLSMWRCINQTPFYQLITDLASESVSTGSYFWRHVSVDDAIIILQSSPSGRRLGAVHESGAITMYELPSLRVYAHWPLKSTVFR